MYLKQKKYYMCFEVWLHAWFRFCRLFCRVLSHMSRLHPQLKSSGNFCSMYHSDQTLQPSYWRLAFPGFPSADSPIILVLHGYLKFWLKREKTSGSNSLSPLLCFSAGVPTMKSSGTRITCSSCSSSEQLFMDLSEFHFYVPFLLQLKQTVIRAILV